MQNHKTREDWLLAAIELLKPLFAAKGYTLPEIGVQLGLSRHTIADYVKQIYRKLNVSSRAEAALGPKFDIKGFHDLLIASGSQPLSIMERRVDDWIAARK